MKIKLYKATESDSVIIAEFLKKLAEFEKLSDYCNVAESQILDLMNEPNDLNALIAEDNGKAVGVMVYYFYKIATFSGKRILYIEDIFIEQAYRKCGIGQMMFEEIKAIGKQLDCNRLEWKCLDWNTSAQSFYDKIGGILEKDEWLTYTIKL